MGLIAASNQVGSSLPVALLVAVLLVCASVPIARRVAQKDSYPALANVMIASAVLHLLCAPAQIFVVDHFYGGVADWLRYDHQGAILATNWRAGHFTLTGVNRLLGDGAVSIAGGVVMTVVGADQLAAFFVFAWLSFLGTILFYRAFAVTFPEANRRRYALLVFFFPSLLFWTADVSKEAVMLLALGLTAYGMAKILVRERAGYLLVVPGAALGLVVRPDELILLVVGFAVAMLVRARDRQRVRTSAIGSLGALVFVAAAVVISGLVTARFIHGVSGSGLTGTLSKVSSNNQGHGVGFGSSSTTYSSNPLWFPRDVYNVLFNPLPITAHSATQFLAALENTVILIVILLSLPQLRILLRTGLQRPYVMMMLFYSLAFLYVFAALGNLGLITRERTLLLPMLLVLMAIPIAPAGQHPYPWQTVRKARRAGRAKHASRGSSERVDQPWPERGPDAWITAQWTGDGSPGSSELVEWSTEDWGTDKSPPWTTQT
jgi:hypothetical protein